MATTGRKKTTTPKKAPAKKTASTKKAAAMGDVKAVEKLQEAREQILGELRHAIVGMDDVIDGFGTLMTDFKELPKLYFEKIKEQAANA